MNPPAFKLIAAAAACRETPRRFAFYSDEYAAAMAAAAAKPGALATPCQICSNAKAKYTISYGLLACPLCCLHLTLEGTMTEHPINIL